MWECTGTYAGCERSVGDGTDDVVASWRGGEVAPWRGREVVKCWSVDGEGLWLGYHSEHVTEPSSAEYLPASQSVQTVAPDPDHFPRAQSVHAEALAFDQEPESHLVQELLAASANVPSLHSSHDEAPLEEAWRPSLHSSHDSAPTRGWYCPASQSEHAEEPDAVLYFPTLVVVGWVGYGMVW